MTEERIEMQEQLQRANDILCASNAEETKTVSKKVFLTVKKNKIIEIQKKAEFKQKTIENLKEIKETEENISRETKNHKNMLEKAFSAVIIRLLNKIPILEVLGQKAEMEERLYNLRKDKLLKDSSELYNKSKEVFALLKEVSDKMIEIDLEAEKSSLKCNDLEQKIAEYKDNQQKIERIQYLRSRTQVNSRRD